ncbi:regulatory signaling modulator protein AmpE [Moritella viscosa]|uniref:AmpE protein n=1 Tax=Moritella viscosa TaxID=80854 RepID=A0A090ING2_9GAMM|nr:regulatory signaling modulator protein AmpE [Moritella viscosa]CED62044.1 AmpD protein [Moritella viscosa]SGY92016.1 AmpE protein [Moritella viscosa]SGY96392.1 AmpE protein [Moritella viscosa]SGZ01987.1 AmpE protein [Moritella viscosa]SGZ02441.1 AmpE protein [Moritella viscosa]
MALISLLLALFIERVVHLSAKLQLDNVLQRYLYPLLPSFINQGLFGTLAIIALPTAVMYSLLDAISGLYYGAFTVLAWLMLLLMSFGGSDYRRDYRQYLKALSRNDLEAKGTYAGCLDVNCERFCATLLTEAVAQQLVWINYRFYFAVIFYFVVLGPVGLTMYVVARSYHKYIIQHHNNQLNRSGIHRVMRVVDWLPARLTMFGYAVVAEEQAALPQSLRSWRDLSTPEFDLLGKVVCLASKANVTTDKCYDYTCYLVQLAKRNIIFFVTIISLLTINGTIN